MQVLIHDNPQSVTDAQLARLLQMVSAQRREKALRYKFKSGRVQSVLVYHLLRQGLSRCYAIDEHPRLDFIAHGKPVLADYPDIHFNISHCKRGVACALDHRPVGIDIEVIGDALDMAVCRHCFNDAETADILQAPSPPERFTVWWTRKEAYLKLTGEGLTDNLPALFDGGAAARVKFDTHVLADKGFVYTTCQRITDDNHSNT